VTTPGAGRAVLGVDLGGTKCHAVLAGADGQLLQEDYRHTAQHAQPVEVLLAVLRELRTAAARHGVVVGAVAIGIPAFIDPRTGLVVGGNNLGWHGFDLASRLAAELPEPHVVENDVNLAALGEAREGAGRDVDSFATVSLGTGLGGAVVVDGRLLRGSHGAAGELGFLLAGRSQLRRPGLMGMESVVGGRAIAARARELAGLDPAATELDPATADAAAVFAPAQRADPVAAQVVDELLDHVALTVIDLAAVVDPARVVLDGSIGRALHAHLPRLTELVRPSVLHPPELVVSTLAPTAALVGAVAEARRLADGELVPGPGLAQV
jgi:glucokinase